MSKLLVIFKDNWADEMDIVGFNILTKEQWEYKELEIRETPFPKEVGVGSNEQITYDNVEQYLAMFTILEISDEEEKTIRKFFGNYMFGIFPLIEGEAPDSFYEKHGYYQD